MKAIKNILFDFGNVLFDIDMARAEHGFFDLFGADAEANRQQLSNEHFFETWEVGGFSEEEFIARLAAFSPKKDSKKAILNIWNSIFLDFPSHRLELLLTLRQKGFGVFMLSNINATHADFIENYMLRKHGLDSSWQHIFFDKIYYSHLIRLRKPTAEAFEHVLIDAQIEAAKTLFIDDLAENVAPAERLGFQIRLHPVRSEVADFLKEKLSI